jgi:MYXO-CTERM domain-containing protein
VDDGGGDEGGDDTPGLIEPPVMPGADMDPVVIEPDMSAADQGSAQPDGPSSVTGTGESCAAAASPAPHGWPLALVFGFLFARARRGRRV